MYLEECLEQLGIVHVDMYRLARKMRQLDVKITSTAERTRKHVQRLFAVAGSLPRPELDARWAMLDEEMDELTRLTVKKVDVGKQMQKYLRSHVEKVHMEVDQAGRLLEEEDLGVTDRMRRKAEVIVEESVRMARDKLKMRRTQRIKAARRKRLNQIRHRRPSEKASPLAEDNQLLEAEDMLVEEMVETPLVEESVPLETVAQTVAVPKAASQTASQMISAVDGVAVAKSDQESQTILKLLTEHAESRHGRVRKVSSRVSNGLMFEMRAKELAVRRLGKAAGTPRKDTPPLKKGRKSQSVATTSTSAAAEAADDDDNRTWCFCNQPSFGFMVACDSRQCPYEWFHGSCVGVEEEFKGKWYCPHCSKKMGH
ncbi:hypothetical protein M514_04931 [Trichuris suis]|uniref:Inhibitor of growth protein n=1 Tax=Trichuris suis TaxID=68888 RepID=A0A085MAA8_9BILA|nr:hypothetical protein M513_04931 [Trichuris suis]KFD71225.1 hypothetical protein M514_04931 [Trichuris suis]KHJ48261.1 PHD-finger [Trichuris suis]